MSDTSERPDRQTVLSRLMTESAGGDWQAFGKLYAMTSQQVYGLILRMTNYAPACEDLLQEVYVAIWRRADRYHPEQAKVMTWIVAIARNRTIDWLRGQGTGLKPRIVEPDVEALELAAGGAGPEESARHAARDTDLEACLDSLSGDQRQAIVLAYLEGHTHAELAERLTTPLGTVKSWVRRGLGALKRCLKELGRSEA